jgi:hypothetical protein
VRGGGQNAPEMFYLIYEQPLRLLVNLNVFNFFYKFEYINQLNGSVTYL